MSRPIRIFHVITRMVRGGAQENTLRTAAHFRGPDWESVLVTGPPDGPEGSMEPDVLRAGVPMISVPDLVVCQSGDDSSSEPQAKM